MAERLGHRRKRGMREPIDIMTSPEEMQQLRASDEFLTNGGEPQPFGTQPSQVEAPITKLRQE